MHTFFSLNSFQNTSSNNSFSTTLMINEPLNNPTFLELFSAYYNDNTSEAKQDALAEHLNTMEYLVAFYSIDDIEIQPSQTEITIHKEDNLSLLISTTSEREIYLPIFTDTAALKHFTSESVFTLRVPAKWLWEFALSQKGFSGVVINPHTISWDLSLEHIQSLLDDINKSH